MTDDAQLLRQYIETRSQTAFADLVQRHLAMVYHAAARQLGSDEHLAGDVAQGVFMLLAAKSHALTNHTSLAGWLHVTTRFKVSEHLRAERRRRMRENVACTMHELMNEESAAVDWRQLQPVIDEVLLELNSDDREAVLLRFFENRPYAEIATRLRLTETAASKRVGRALERLREKLGRRGIKSTASALGTVFTGQSALATPAGLAASITGAVFSAGFQATTVVGVISLMSTKTTIAAAVALVVMSGIAIRQVNAKRDAESSLATLQSENAAVSKQLRARIEQGARATNQVTNARSAATPPVKQPTSNASPPSGGLASVEESRAFLQAHPDVREALAHYTNATIAHENAELLSNMALAEPEREKFIALLAKGRRRIVGDHQLTLAETEFAPGEYARQLRELLGDARYQQYRDFNNTALLRNITSELARSLYFTNAPLASAQAGVLRQIVSNAIADPALGPKYTGGVWPYVPDLVWNRILEDAQSVLPEPQLEAIRELQQQSHFWHAQSAASKAYRAAQTATKSNGK